MRAQRTSQDLVEVQKELAATCETIELDTDNGAVVGDPDEGEFRPCVQALVMMK